MGILDRLRKPTRPVIPVELSPEGLAAAESCHQTGADVGQLTRGRGSAQSFNVAGTSHRQPAMEAIVEGRGGPATTEGTTLPAVLLRQPDNPHDRNAIRVLLDGIHVGFVPATEARRLQPLLLECERRNEQLVGSARLWGSAGSGWGAQLQVRPDLDGWKSAAVKKPAPKKKPAKAAPPVALLEGGELARVVKELQDLVEQEPVRTKQRAGSVAKRVRELLPALEAHAAAWEALEPDRGLALADEVDDLPGYVEDMLDAEDADDREDAHGDLQCEIQEVLDELDR